MGHSDYVGCCYKFFVKVVADAGKVGYSDVVGCGRVLVYEILQPLYEQ